MTPTSLDLAAKPYDPQPKSPLFSVLPGELRNEIFAYALVQYEDDENAYPEDSYWYRPGFSGPRRSSSALLRTCRLAYLEGQKVFLKELEWAFWFDRGPEGRSGNRACDRFFDSLTPQQSRDLQLVRFFTQMYWLEDGGNLLRLLCLQPRFRPARLTVTIRYSDWWFWEQDEPLRMREGWLARFSGPLGMRELRVEYETLASKRDEMMAIVRRNKEWKLEVRGSEDEGVAEGHLSAEGTALREWRWTGTSKLDGKTWEHHGEGDTVEYVVVEDRWTFREGPMSEEDRRRRHDHEDVDDNDWDDEDNGTEEGDSSVVDWFDDGQYGDVDSPGPTSHADL
ncbi:hypothetical protein CSOJ01_09254 [Colletotrichum sojae]|uniref:Uncharacterized protein n=1 Tax=Colletotrichum sojae TaxID=2175907 RepID=A0A8H6J3F1_9PEZI|nr:hypothetical protein CSOJ01_09254 [Colletotrichum sojae]